MERNKSKMVMVVAIAAILGIGTYAFANRGGFGMDDWGQHTVVITWAGADLDIAIKVI